MAAVVAVTAYLGATTSHSHSAAIATIPVGRNPWDAAVAPTGRTAYVTDSADGTVSVIDTATRTVTATIPAGKVPEGVAVDPSGHTLYVADHDSDTVSVIDR